MTKRQNHESSVAVLASVSSTVDVSYSLRVAMLYAVYPIAGSTNASRNSFRRNICVLDGMITIAQGAITERAGGALGRIIVNTKRQIKSATRIGALIASDL